MRFEPSFLADIRDRLPVSHLVGRYVKLARAGAELRGLSPFNAEKSPSFYANDRKQAWFDFSANRNGNIFTFLMQLEGLSFPAAVEQCAQEAGVSMPAGHRSGGQAADPALRAAREADWRRKQDARLADEARRQKGTRELAYDLWKEGRPIEGTAADLYLRSRGIDFGAQFSSLRFHPRLDYRDPETQTVTRWPALIAAVRAPDDGRFLAIWRIFLDPSGAKAAVPNAKLGLGSYTEAGGSVWLGQPGPVAHVCEGIETALGVVGILGQRQPVQAALSTSGLVNFTPPAGVSNTVIWPDGDKDRIKADHTGAERWTESPGLAAATRLQARLAAEHHPCTIQPIPKKGRDFLDIYREGKRYRDGY